MARFPRSLVAWEAVVDAGAPLGPALGDDLRARVEQDPLAAVHVEVAEQAVLPASERERCRWDGDRNIDAHHPGGDPAAKLPRDAAVVREDRRAVAVRVR